MAHPSTHIELAFNDEVGLNRLGYRWASDGYRGHVVGHRYWDLVHITHGDATIRYDGTESVIGAGSTLLLDPFSDYRIDSNGPGGVCYLFSQFSFHFDPRRSVRTDLNLPVLDECDVDGSIQRLRRIASEVHARRDSDLSAYRKAMHELVIGIVHAITTPTPDRTHANGFARRVRQFLAHNSHGALNMQMVAKAFYLSPSHLARRFKVATGLTVKQYHHKLRMRHAADLVTRTDRSVTDIADDMGFQTIHHFSRRFKHFYGASPIEYRNQNAGIRDGTGPDHAREEADPTSGASKAAPHRACEKRSNEPRP